MNKVPRWVFRYVGNKTFDFSSKKKDFLPKNDQIWPKTGIFGQFGPGHAGLFSALLVGRLVVVARGLYLARHLFTLSIVYIRVVEKEDPLPRAIPSWPEESSALTTSTDFYIGHSMYLYFCILCICTFGFFVSAFLLHLFRFQTLESHCCKRSLIRKLFWHITL